MPNCPGDRLDEYLAGCLSAEEAARLEAHLADYPACREAVEQGRRMERVLVRAAERLAPLPASLVDRIEGQIRTRRRRRAFRRAVGVAAAAAILLAVGVWLVPHEGAAPPKPRSLRPQAAAERPAEPAPDPEVDPERESETEPKADAHEAAPARTTPREKEPRARVALLDPSDGILVPIETSHPNVTMVWVHPTFRPSPTAPGPGAGNPR
jgi:hypothetical protein